MSLLEILEVPHPGLRAVAAPVAAVDDAVRAIVADMFDTMYDARGIGLAATQVGIEQRIVVIDLQEPESDAEDAKPVREPRVYINPELVSVSEETSIYNEGCLSIPEQYAEVERPTRCRVKWLDGEGVAQEDDFDGLLATCIQHEIDHLNGVLFIDHISRLKRDMVLKKLAKARKAA
ncbi:MAG: peptide deformylase [Sphingomonas bacterium]|jgi:peptide deformylase|uniref:peptide deformylase n=1 Tax=Sphingomonas bacterium TaxID=1895847 RepID=UPI00263A0855|nr:peptide deformylase [Sphingomonas bacterium]MDB5704649.1 peptide deformylase [Sphingomonas bacterium]